MRTCSFNPLTASISLAALAALFASTAGACGTNDLVHARTASHLEARAAFLTEAEAAAPIAVEANDSIVGMWKITFTATDGSGFTDFGYEEWHSDGTEFFNSGGRAPSTGNFCLGVWQKTSGSVYLLNHFALAYDNVSGDLVNKINIRLAVTPSSDRSSFSGVFENLIYDSTGTIHQATIQGNVTATRITVATTAP